MYLKHCIKNGAQLGIEVDEFQPKYCPSQIQLVQGDFRRQEVVDKTPSGTYTNFKPKYSPNSLCERQIRHDY
ncbi:MAG: hypothetical protein MGG11_10070 [Trichodesmium sp. MAG_R03]|nr:hypothetical protein [Trichodesmium sp. MAG_R03]